MYFEEGMKLNMNEKVKDILEWIECIIIAVVLALLIRYFVGTPTIVQQRSMYPNLQQGDRLILNRLSRTFNKEPERFDIITFEAPSKTSYRADEVDLSNPVAEYANEPTNLFSKFTYYVLEWNKTSYIKRVIGMPGDYIKIENGKVYLNGEELDESAYLKDDVTTDASGDNYFKELKVPEGYVFVMGDNRAESGDSRRFGCIPINKIEGKVLIRFWPFNKIGTIKKAE
jgi:signal peptidase I